MMTCTFTAPRLRAEMLTPPPTCTATKLASTFWMVSFVAVQVGTGVNISARSLGAVNVQVIMESLGGGGHQTMAAAQLKHITPEAARARIQTAIDQYRESQKKTSSEANAEPKKKDNKP